MKKKIKLAILAIICLGIGTSVAVFALSPMEVSVVTLTPRDATQYFIEQGFVKEDRSTDIFAFASGEITALYVTQGQHISAGDAIATVNTTELHAEIAQIYLNNQALQAQIRNLGVQNQQTRLNQQATLGALQGEYDALLAQQASAQANDNDIQRTREENIRLQDILINQSQAQLDTAITQKENMQQLYQVGAVARTDIEQANNAINNARASLDANLQQLEIIKLGDNAQNGHFDGMRTALQAQISGIQNSLSLSTSAPMQDHFNALINSGNLTIEALERRIANSTIVSPVSGTIETLYIESTNIVHPNTPIARVATNQEHVVEVFVSTLDINEIQIGDEVDLILRRQSGDSVHLGIVQDIGTRAETKVSPLGIEERRVKVTVAVANEDNQGLFMSGFDVDVRFRTFNESEQLLVPRTAVFDISGTDYVFVVDGGQVALRPITLGFELRAYYVVNAGLSPQEQVIRDANQEGLQEGVRISANEHR